MQVSWIDAERLRELVEQIAPQGGCVEETPCAMEIQTAPEPLPGPSAESWGFAVDWPEPTVLPAPVAASHETFVAEPEPQAEMEHETDDDEHHQPAPNPAAALPLSRIRDKLRAIRQRASDAGILTRMSQITAPPPSSQRHMADPASAADEADDEAEEAAGNQENPSSEMEPPCLADSSQTPAFDIPHGSREARLTAFADWAKLMVREDGGQILVMSDDGEVLWGGASKAGLVLSTMMAWGAALRTSALSACETPSVIHQPLASGNILTVIPCETAVGMVHFAVASPSGVTHELAHILRGALRAAMA